MNVRMKRIKMVLLISLLGCGLLVFDRASARQQELPKHPPVTSDGGGQVVQLCDGETSITVKGVAPGERLTPEQARTASDELMRLWYAKQDPATALKWQQEAKKAVQTPSRADVTVKKPAPGSEQTKDITARDISMWERELKREIDLGNQIFHDDKLIGSTNGVSCAMCHPNAANTHPETYPKFQIQLKRVALLRDMINWCIENPSRGKKLSADDEKMRAVEAYILAQRKGVAMEYGKH